MAFGATPLRVPRNAIALIVVFSFPLLAVGILFYVRSAAQRGVIADPAIYAAQTSPELNSLLGNPMQAGKPAGIFVSKGGSGNADLKIPLQGPKGKGLLLEWAQQKKGQWHLCSLSFRPEHGTTIPILDASATHCEAE